ncbi:MAG TPA: NUDIX domain-containing protein [Chitinophagaceae bacterium]|nr:NUDIX domain-containing protein [Chitinophagaceae bacterium]
MFNFNVRVYGLYIEFGNILVSDEIIKGQNITKFPGGGLEDGEGTHDCLKREWIEELQQKIEVKAHFYTTDFYQKSGFGDGSQIISIYYYVQPLEPLKVPLSEKPFNFNQAGNNRQSFRMIPLEVFSKKEVDLPIDKVVAELLEKH